MSRFPATAALSAANNRLGIAFICAASACYITSDVLTKLVADTLPLGQILFMRGLFATPMILVLAFWRGGFRDTSVLFRRPLIIRTFGDVMATVLYLSALFKMPIANSTALLQTTPLVTTAGAALFLGEKVGIRRWMAVLVGFVGMLIIVRPGLSGFTIWSLVALSSVIFIAIRDMSTRLLPPEISTFEVAAISSIAVTFVGAAMAIGETWQSITLIGYIYLFASAVAIMGAYACITLAMRLGEISVVAPFRYTIMIWAILFQILIFGILPDGWSLIGTAILIATGIYTFYREQKVSANHRILELDAE